MNTYLNTRALAWAGALSGAALVTLCFAIYAVLGLNDPWMPLFMGSGPTVTGWLIGIAEGGAVGWLVGMVTGWSYNRLARPAAGGQ